MGVALAVSFGLPANGIPSFTKTQQKSVKMHAGPPTRMCSRTPGKGFSPTPSPLLLFPSLPLRQMKVPYLPCSVSTQHSTVDISTFCSCCMPNIDGGCTARPSPARSRVNCRTQRLHASLVLGKESGVLCPHLSLSLPLAVHFSRSPLHTLSICRTLCLCISCCTLPPRARALSHALNSLVNIYKQRPRTPARTHTAVFCKLPTGTLIDWQS